MINPTVQRKEKRERCRLKTFDLLIIGGGASGAGILRDASQRGLSTLLVEKGDFAGETSHCSTKLVHGGVRYLELAIKKCNIRYLELVQEALSERKHFFSVAPHLCQKLPIIALGKSPFETLKFFFGLKLYGWLAKDPLFPPPKLLLKKALYKKVPHLLKGAFSGGVLFYDGQFQDAKFVMALIKTAMMEGGEALNYFSVDALIHEKGRCVGVSGTDTILNERVEFFAKRVVNAAGPFVDEIKDLDEAPHEKSIVFSRGTHLGFDHDLKLSGTALLHVLRETKKPLFLIPWGGGAILGTTDIPCKGADDKNPSQKEFLELLEGLQTTLSPSFEPNAYFSGIRPLLPGDEKDTKDLIRESRIDEDASGLLTLRGGKWTTYRKMAEDLVNLLTKTPCNTKDSPLVDLTENYKKPLDERIRYYIDEEMTYTLDDLLFQRENIGLLSFEKALKLQEQALPIFQEKLCLSDEQAAKERESVKAKIDRLLEGCNQEKETTSSSLLQ